MFNARCPECNNDVEVINGRCSKCNFDISNYMAINGLCEGNQLITDKVFICPNCGDIEASTGRLYLKCSECGHPYKATDIDRKNPIKNYTIKPLGIINSFSASTSSNFTPFWTIYLYIMPFS